MKNLSALSNVYLLLLFSVCGFILFPAISCNDGTKGVETVVPNGIQLAWADAEVGVLIHLD
ncbi:MAG: hypothetical protein LBM08_04035, partial [Dysgonamonadaceae bacterium]|nr:hypothetical protein [Dysgonamonadaceae bacterium]